MLSVNFGADDVCDAQPPLMSNTAFFNGFGSKPYPREQHICFAFRKTTQHITNPLQAGDLYILLRFSLASAPLPSCNPCLTLTQAQVRACLAGLQPR